MRVKRGVGVSNEITVPVIRALGELGLSIDALLPVGATALGEPHLNHQAADAGLDAAERLLSDEALGITIASRIPVGALGVLDYALCTSSVLRDGLRRAGRPESLGRPPMRSALARRSNANGSR